MKRTIPPEAGKLTVFMRDGQGRSNVSIDWCGVRVLVDRESEDSEAAAAELARMPVELAEARERIASLDAQLAKARAALPPAQPLRVFDGGCVRQDPADSRKVWLLSKPETGWRAFGVQLDGWHDLFARYAVVVGNVGRDEAGTFWLVHPRSAAGEKGGAR